MARVATSQIPRRYEVVEQPFISGNEVELLRDGAEAYPSMLEAIAAAKSQVLLEMYWFDSDPAGLSFADALRAAAERGVEVAVIYDSVGSFGADPAMFAALRSAGDRCSGRSAR
jgi:cardiolipin synthase